MVQWKRCRWRKSLSNTHTHVLLTAPADGRVGCSHTLRHGYPQISPHTPTHTLTCVSHSNRPCGNLKPLLLLTHTYTQKKTQHMYDRGWSYRSDQMFLKSKNVKKWPSCYMNWETLWDVKEIRCQTFSVTWGSSRALTSADQLSLCKGFTWCYIMHLTSHITTILSLQKSLRHHENLHFVVHFSVFMDWKCKRAYVMGNTECKCVFTYPCVWSLTSMCSPENEVTCLGKWEPVFLCALYIMHDRQREGVCEGESETPKHNELTNLTGDEIRKQMTRTGFYL